MADSSVVLSFPAILRNPGLSSRFTHLQASMESGLDIQGSAQVNKRLREQNEGKRWLRRNANARFVGNPHIVTASQRDYTIPVPQTQPTFPEPLPHYLPRTVKIPPASSPATDMASANAGRFSVSLKGMRRDLRRAGGRAADLVRDVETAIVEWLNQGGTVLRPDIGNNILEGSDGGRPIGNDGAIVEVSRTPLQLIWRIPDDAFARYVVHCCARYYEVVSFSKGVDQNRLTYLLRPNVTRPDRRTIAAMETPPVTDIEYSSNPDTDIDSDFVSERDLESDVELNHNHNNLASIPEGDHHHHHHDMLSLFDDAEHVDLEDFDSTSEFGGGLEASVDILQARLEGLSVNAAAVSAVAQPPVTDQVTLGDARGTEQANSAVRTFPLRKSPGRLHEWGPVRSPSSPSRSPVRLRRRRKAAAKKRAVAGLHATKSFYNYLYH